MIIGEEIANEKILGNKIVYRGLALKLKEHEGKALFRMFGIPTNDGYLVKDASEVRKVDRPMVVKAQVQIGGRGKAGGIRFASTLEQVRRAVSEIVGMEIGGQRVREALIEERVSVDREFYLSFFMDRRSRLPRMIMLREGGMDVEAADPSMVMSWGINPLIGVPNYVHREAALEIILDSGPARQLKELMERAWRLFWEMDCELLEINPLVLSQDGGLMALDSKVVIDEDAVYRHPELQSSVDELTTLEAEAKAKGMSLVQLDGDVGVIANGAGLTMATLDVLALHHAKGGVFLDLGGTDDERTVEEALDLVSRARPRVILVNIFGGITKCDTVAEGVIKARSRLGEGMGLVVRLRGVNEEKARGMLAEEGILALKDLDEACAKAAMLRSG